MVRDVNMDTLILTLKTKNMIIMDMITETATKVILMDMLDMTMRI
jgi:hypothetical protein